MTEMKEKKLKGLKGKVVKLIRWVLNFGLKKMKGVVVIEMTIIKFVAKLKKIKYKI